MQKNIGGSSLRGSPYHYALKVALQGVPLLQTKLRAV